MLDLEQSRLINLYRIWNGYSPAPAVVSFILTSRCNLDCSMCPQAKSRSKFAEWTGKELEFEKIKKVIDHIPFSFFKPRIHLSGGEPLLYKSFLPLIKYLKKKKIKWSMTTNGFVLKEFAPQIINCKPQHISVSIDGPQEIHNKIRGVANSFQNAISGIREIRRIRKEKGYGCPKIAVNCAIQSENYLHLEEFIRSIENSGADSLTLEHFFFDRRNKWSMAMVKEIDVALLKEQMLKIKSARYSIPVNFFPKIKFSDIKNYYSDISHNFGNKCIAPWLIGRVSSSGNVRPCREAKAVGNLVEQPLKKIWNNAQFKKFRKGIKAKGILKGTSCDRCCHRQYYPKTK